MAAYRTWVPNALSLSRVPAALAFVVVYAANSKALFFSALAIAFTALLTDIIDGPLARRWQVTSEQGYFLDGLGDKAFYVAVLLTMIREQATLSALAWVLIVREIVLYALRTIDQSRAENIKSLRFFSKAYAFFIRLYFGFFFLADAFKLYGNQPPTFLQYGDVWGYIAALLGVYSTFQLGRGIAQRT